MFKLSEKSPIPGPEIVHDGQNAVIEFSYIKIDGKPLQTGVLDLSKPGVFEFTNARGMKLKTEVSKK